MDGMLSQDEINALLGGMNLSDDTAPAEAQTEEAPAGGGLSLNGESLTAEEKDAIGEVANISMGSSATTLYSLVNRKVNITTPEVALATWDEMLNEYERPCVFIQIKYTHGLDGSNILVLRENDVKIITDLMMGGDGINTEDTELGELHLSAISEAMNQMMGAAATSLSTMMGRMIDISPPEASLLNLEDYKRGDEVAPFLGGVFVKISFRMQIGDLVDSSIMQLYPIDFSRAVVDVFTHNEPAPEPAPAAAPAPVPAASPAPAAAPAQPAPAAQAAPPGSMPMGMEAQPYGMPPYGMPPYGMPYAMPPYGAMPPWGMDGSQNPTQGVPVAPAQFQNFQPNMAAVPGGENIGLIMDVPLEVTVELGRTSKSISEILDFAPGTIIELDRIAGEPIDVLVNGKFVAKGEVVVIEESFGIRVTEIIK